jgi:EmrB/QacA subfamily drug resistance transporter
MNTTKHRWLILVVCAVTQLVLVLDGTIVNIALPRAQAELDLSDGLRQWVVAGYALAFGALLLLGGRVADYWGRKRTFVTGLIIFAAGSLLGGLAPTGVVLVTARVTQGVAAALMAPAALAFVTLAFPKGRERNTAFAIFGCIGGVGSALGMVLGGVLTEFLGWRWCLLVNVPLVGLGLVAGLILLSESRADGHHGYDLPGAGASVVGFGLFVLGLSLDDQPWRSPLSLGLVAGGIVVVALFVVIEKRSAHPLLPLAIVTHRTRGTAFIVQAVVGLAGFTAMLYLAFHLQQILGFTPLWAGLATLPFTVALNAMVPFAIKLMNRCGARRQLVFGPLVSAAGMAWMSGLTPTGSYWVQILPGLVLMAAGMGFTLPPLQNLALAGVPPRDAGVASATANATNQIGGAVGLALLTALYVGVAGSATTPGPVAQVAGYSAVFLASAAIWVAAAVLAFFALRPPRASAIPGAPATEARPEPQLTAA